MFYKQTEIVVFVFDFQSDILRCFLSLYHERR
nr:MAG TPA: hypothetical protein [Caudoviricetes sp.]